MSQWTTQAAIPAFGWNQRRKTLALVVGILAVLAGIAVFGLLIGEAASAPDFSQKNLPPSFSHWFGTDWLGRDMLLRTIKGLSTSILIGVGASCVSAGMAAIAGTAAAIGPKWLDDGISWLIDLVMGIPHLVLLILISFVLGKGQAGVMVGIMLTHWPSLARLIRGEVLERKHEPYLALSQKLGKSGFYRMSRHMLPHIVPQFVVGLILLFPHAILHEAAITFLGFGLSPEQPAVGVILSESMKYLTAGMWWLAFFPGLMLVLVVLLFERLGNAVRLLLDPHSAQL